MDISVSLKSQIPVYEQIYRQIAGQILSGVLAADFCLPSLRTISTELGISIITVKKAWEILEQNGFIYTKAGVGCFVCAEQTHKLDEIKLNLASQKLQENLPFYRDLGMEKQQLIDLIEELY